MSEAKKIDNVASINSVQTKSILNVNIKQLLKSMVDNEASDLHISADTTATMRINGSLVKIKMKNLTKEDTKQLLTPILSSQKEKELYENNEIDLSLELNGVGRFRVNIFFAKGAMSGSFRYIPSEVPTFRSLGLPNIIIEMTNVRNGLILITGPTGSGKTTTLAAMVDYINTYKKGHIITLEDPIEYQHKHRSCLVNQRELGSDMNTFERGIRSLLRQDANYVMVGELRDRETIEGALKIAETGSLVFGTLHTNSAIQTMSRIINIFPAEKQDQVRVSLSFTLQGVISQQLLARTDKPGRVLALEVLIPNSGIRNLIRENKVPQIYSQMQLGQGTSGMMTMNQSLLKFLEIGTLDREAVLGASTMKEEMMKRLGLSDG